MATDVELDRLAIALHAMRADWPQDSLRTYLAEHASVAYADLAVAAVAVATDPDSRTPRRLSEAGPWWQLVRQDTSARVGPGDEPRCAEPGHEHELARACRACRAELIAAPDDPEPPDR